MEQQGYGDVLHRSQSLIILGTHTHQPSWRGHCTCRAERAVPWAAFASGDHPFKAKMGHPPAQEELLLICKQTQPVLLLGRGSSCTLLAG